MVQVDEKVEDVIGGRKNWLTKRFCHSQIFQGDETNQFLSDTKNVIHQIQL